MIIGGIEYENSIKYIESMSKRMENNKKNASTGNYIILFRPLAYVDSNSPVFIILDKIEENEKITNDIYTVHKKHKKILKNLMSKKCTYMSKDLTLGALGIIDFLQTYNEGYKYKKIKFKQQ